MVSGKNILSWGPFNKGRRVKSPALSSAGNEQTGIGSYKDLVDLVPTGLAYFEIVLNAAGDPVDCRYLFVNKSFERISGLLAEQVVGRTMREVSSGMEEISVLFLAHVALSSEPATMEWFSGKQKRHYIVHAFSNRRGFCAISFEDVTERAQAEEKLRSAYSRLSSIMELSEDIIFRLDTEGVIQSLSSAVETIVGYTKEELLGHRFFDFVVPEDMQIAKAAQKEVVSGNSVRSVAFRVKSKDGQVVFIEVNSMPVREQGRVVGQQGTVRNITARKEAEDALRQKTLELELERHNLQTIFNYAQVGMLLVDSQGVIRRANEAAARQVNKNPQELLGRRPGEAFSCAELVGGGKACGEPDGCCGCPLWNNIITVLQTGRALPPVEVAREFMIDGKRSTVWMEIGAARVSISGASDVILSVADITERKKIEVSLRHSEKRIGDIINAFPLPFFFKDMEGRYLIFNQEFVSFTGLPEQKLRNATVYDVAPKEIADIILEKDRDLLAHPGSQVFEVSYPVTDGSLRDVVFFKRTLHDIDGRLQGIVGALLDITERKRTEARVKDSERRLQAFLNATPVPMFLKNTDGIFVFCNQAFAAFHGLQIKEVLGRTVHQIVPKNIADMLAEQDQKLLQDGETVVAEVGTIRLGKEPRNIIIYKNLHYDAGGKVVGIVGTFMDITERKQAEQEVRKRGEEVKEALSSLQLAHEQLQKTQEKMVQTEKLAAIGLLAAGVAHEVNNPLGFIGSNLTILEGYIKDMQDYFSAQRSLFEPGPENDLERLKAELIRLETKRNDLGLDEALDDLPSLMAETREGFERIRKIVYELRNFSRSDQLLEQPVDVNATLEAVLRMLWNEIKYKVDLHKDLGKVRLIRGNPHQLGQVFMNILVNAHQAIKEKGNIFIRTYSTDKDVGVEISDDGVGIPAEIMGKIFDPFFTTKAPGEGTGLGLSVSYDIVKRHGGSIGAESEPGKGTKFVITFPVLQPDIEELGAAGA